MEAQAAKSTHPILIIAGIAVTVFSLVGVAAIMGWVPTSKGQTEPAAALTAPASAPAPVAQAPETPAPAPRVEKHVAKKPAPKHAQVARAEQQTPAAAVPPPPPAPVVP